MSVDKWLDKTYKLKTYTCSDFTRDVWLDLTGVDIGAALAGLLGQQDAGRIERRHVKSFRELSTPSDPCLVLLQRHRTPVHMGVFIRGKLLHIVKTGPKFQRLDIAARLFPTVRFIQCTL